MFEVQSQCTQCTVNICPINKANACQPCLRVCKRKTICSYMDAVFSYFRTI